MKSGVSGSRMLSSSRILGSNMLSVCLQKLVCDLLRIPGGGPIAAYLKEIVEFRSLCDAIKIFFKVCG